MGWHILLPFKKHVVKEKMGTASEVCVILQSVDRSISTDHQMADEGRGLALRHTKLGERSPTCLLVAEKIKEIILCEKSTLQATKL